MNLSLNGKSIEHSLVVSGVYKQTQMVGTEVNTDFMNTLRQDEVKETFVKHSKLGRLVGKSGRNLRTASCCVKRANQ